jgi:uncharacterized membrane protein
MYGVIKWMHVAALIGWIGAIAFFSFVVAPSVFRAFPTAEAGRVVGAIFPTYYRIGYACGVILVASSAVFLIKGVSRAWWGVATLLSAAMLAATLYAGIVVQPQATSLRPQLHDPAAPASAKDEFDRLHRTAVLLNGAVLLGGVALSAITAVRLQP